MTEELKQSEVPPHPLDSYVDFIRGTLWKLYKAHPDLSQVVAVLDAMDDAGDDAAGDGFGQEGFALNGAIAGVLEDVHSALFGDNET